MAQRITKQDIASPGAYTVKSDLTKELLKRDNPQTPDYLSLKLQKQHLLFVYGTLMKDGSFHDILKDYPCFGNAYTATRNWMMRSVKDRFPVVIPSQLGQEAASAKVYGEVYIIPPELFLTLDQIESNGTMYERSLHWFWLTDQSFKTKGGTARPSVKAWMYVGRPSWVYQQSTSICVKKTINTNNMYEERYFAWDNNKDTQLSHLQSIWDKFGLPSLAQDRLPF